MHTTSAHDDVRPPKFLFAEVVSVVGATGTERDEFDEPIDARDLIGREFVVQGARPSDDRQGWVIYLWIDELDAICAFPEDILEDTGLIEMTDEKGDPERVPLDPDRDAGWRDDVMLYFETLIGSEEEAEADCPGRRVLIARTCRSGRCRVAAHEMARRTVLDHPLGLSVGDALDAFKLIVESVGRGWEHQEDESVFISSRWELPDATPSFSRQASTRSASPIAAGRRRCDDRCAAPADVRPSASDPKRLDGKSVYRMLRVTAIIGA